MSLKAVFAIMVVLLLSAGAKAANCDDVTFEDEQLWNLQKAYDFGSRYDKGYTMAAILWQESSAGKHLKRKDGEHWSMSSYGPFHILLKTASHRRECHQSECRDVRRKLNNFEYSANLSLEELLYWEARLGSLGKAVAAYNRGNNWNTNGGRNYLKKINAKIRYLKQCVRL